MFVFLWFFPLRPTISKIIVCEVILVSTKLIIWLFCVILLAECYISTAILNCVSESQAQFVPLVSASFISVRFIWIGEFPKGNGKIISSPFKRQFPWRFCFLRHKKTVVWNSFNGSRLDTNSKLLQLPGRDLIWARQRDSPEIALSHFTTASHWVPARCCPQALLLKLICQRYARLQVQYYIR